MEVLRSSHAACMSPSIVDQLQNHWPPSAHWHLVPLKKSRHSARGRSIQTSFFPALGFFAVPIQSPVPSTAACTVCASKRSNRKSRSKPALIDTVASPSLPELQASEDGEKALGDLQNWVKAKEPGQKVTAKFFGHTAGRGLVALGDVRAGEVVLKINKEQLLTTDGACTCPEVGEALREGKVPEWPALATLLLRERSQGPRSHWAPYIAALPAYSETVLQWSAGEVDQLLRGSPLLSQALELRRDVEEVVRDLREAVLNKHPNLFTAEDFSAEAYLWAFSTVISRVVRLPSAGNKLALVPFADLANHSPQVSSCFEADKDWAVVLKADRPYKEGDQVYASYGPRSSGELLLSYGFAPPVGSNPHDSVKLQLRLVPDDPMFAAKELALATFGLKTVAAFAVKMEGLPQQLLAFARLVVLPPQQAALLADLAAAASDRPPAGTLPADVALEEEVASMELILRTCEGTLAGYGTSLEEDEVLAKGASLQERGGGSVKGPSLSRAVAVARVRVGERNILLRTCHVLRAELKGLKAQLAKGGAGRGLYGGASNKEQGAFSKLASFLRRP